MILKFKIPGKAVGKGRPRVTRHGTYTPQNTVRYMNDVRNAYGDRYYFGSEAVFMEVVAYFPIPKRTTKKAIQAIADMDYLYTHKPDGDNVLKAIKDALNGVAYADDACVVYESCLRKYAKPGETPRTEVTIYDLVGGRIDD